MHREASVAHKAGKRVMSYVSPAVLSPVVTGRRKRSGYAGRILIKGFGEAICRHVHRTKEKAIECAGEALWRIKKR